MPKADNLPPSCAVVMKSGNLNFLEPSEPLQACNGTALPLPFLVIFTDEHRYVIYFIISVSVKTSFHSKHACAATCRAQGRDERDLYFVSVNKDMRGPGVA